MSNKPEEFVVESTPVVDLSKHRLDGPENFSANDALESWDNEKTEVYVDSEDDTGNAALIDDAGDRHPITAFPYVLGRGTECDFVLTGKGVSRKHAEIIFQSGRFVINDLQSLNGIKVNGYKVNRVILEEDDVIKLGEVSLNFTSGREEDQKKKKKAKKKPEPQVVSSADDPFGKSTSKKLLTTVSTLVIGVVLAGGGYYYYSSSQQQLASRAVVATAPQQQATATAPAAAQVQTSATAQSTVSEQPVTKKPSVAPPPSLSMAPSKPLPSAKTQEPKVKSVTPTPATVEPKTAAIPEPKPKSKQPEVSADTTSAKRLVATAEERYLAGEADSLFGDMNRYENNSRVSPAVRAQVKSKHEELARLYNDYVRGSKAHVSGNKDLAFEHWGRFMEREKAFFNGRQRSVYADQVAVRVIEEYVDRGTEASKEGKNHEAYRLWEKALSIGESVAAKIAIENADARAKQLYRKALRLEYVNSNQAKQLWQEVIDLVPPGSEYHTKASSKLAWYERWGA